MKAKREEKSAAKIAAYMRGQERITTLVRAENDSYKAKREAAALAGITPRERLDSSPDQLQLSDQF
jgi:hypothetical protein